jgi:hypothetical protein
VPHAIRTIKAGLFGHGGVAHPRDTSVSLWCAPRPDQTSIAFTWSVKQATPRWRRRALIRRNRRARQLASAGTFNRIRQSGLWKVKHLCASPQHKRRRPNENLALDNWNHLFDWLAGRVRRLKPGLLILHRLKQLHSMNRFPCPAAQGLYAIRSRGSSNQNLAQWRVLPNSRNSPEFAFRLLL